MPIELNAYVKSPKMKIVQDRHTSHCPFKEVNTQPFRCLFLENMEVLRKKNHALSVYVNLLEDRIAAMQ